MAARGGGRRRRRRGRAGGRGSPISHRRAPTTPLGATPLARLGGPLVVCVGPAAPQPRAASEAQRRIGLLAVEQAAWALADADPRFEVAGSRTELDWALKSGRIVVWAPTHMAMAALGPGVPDASDPAGLAAWLAREIGADPVAPAEVPADIVALQEEEPR